MEPEIANALTDGNDRISRPPAALRVTTLRTRKHDRVLLARRSCSGLVALTLFEAVLPSREFGSILSSPLASE